MTKCWFCGAKMIWQNDFSFEDYLIDGDGVVAVLVCSDEECGAMAEFYTGEGLSIE